jgi:hypothetical protein
MFDMMDAYEYLDDGNVKKYEEIMEEINGEVPNVRMILMPNFAINVPIYTLKNAQILTITQQCRLLIHHEWACVDIKEEELTRKEMSYLF